jgi:hypothetical protein
LPFLDKSDLFTRLFGEGVPKRGGRWQGTCR